MEREEGEDGQLLHTPTSNSGTLDTFIHPGGGSPCHHNGMERKKNYPMAEERLQLPRFSAQKMFKVTLLEKKKKKKNEQNRTGETQFNSRVQTSLTLQKLLVFLYTHNTMNEKGRRQPVDNDGNNTKKMPKSPSNPRPIRPITQKMGQETR